MATAQLFVGRLSKDSRQRDIEETFGRYGRLTRCEVKYGTGTAYAFVDYDDKRDAEDAIRRENNREIDGQRIVVEWAHGPKRGFSDDQCYKCGKPGHFARACRSPTSLDSYSRPRFDGGRGRGRGRGSWRGSGGGRDGGRGGDGGRGDGGGYSKRRYSRSRSRSRSRSKERTRRRSRDRSGSGERSRGSDRRSPSRSPDKEQKDRSRSRDHSRSRSRDRDDGGDGGKQKHNANGYEDD